METYFVDKWDASRGYATLKSFERGHTVDDADATEDLRNW
jgi:hypothetical protein